MVWDTRDETGVGKAARKLTPRPVLSRRAKVPGDPELSNGLALPVVG
jgi:hypothetical protein